MIENDVDERLQARGRIVQLAQETRHAIDRYQFLRRQGVMLPWAVAEIAMQQASDALVILEYVLQPDYQGPELDDDD